MSESPTDDGRKTWPGNHSVDFISHSLAQTQRIGQRLGELAEAGDIFLLIGELGSGKTTLTQGIARGLNIIVPITSPSFTFINEYTPRDHGARLALYHIDLYRLNYPEEETLSLGLEEYLYGNGLCVVEWAEKIDRLWPEERLIIKLKFISETKRGVRLEPCGERYLQLVEEFKKRAFAIW